MLMKKYISIFLIVFVFFCVPVRAEDNLPAAPTAAELSVTIPENATAVAALNNSDFTKSGVRFSVETNYVEYQYISLGGAAGCYQFTRKAGVNGGTPYFMNRSDFSVKANRNYRLSVLVYCNFSRADCEVNLGFRVCNQNGAEILIDAFHGLPAQTDGWYRFETVLTTPQDAATARFYGVMYGFENDANAQFYLADIDMWELPEETMMPLGEGEGLSFSGSSGKYDMKVFAPSDSGSRITVRTTGAEFCFDRTTDSITVKQRIGIERELAVLKSENKSLSALKLYSKTDKEVILTTGNNGISFGIQADGLLLVSAQGADAQLCVAPKIVGAWNRLLSGNLLVMDDVGGFTVNPAIPLGTGRTVRFSVNGEVDFERDEGDVNFISNAGKDWSAVYTVSSGERLGVTAFPPREYDWENSFDCIYANVDAEHSLGTEVWSNYKSQHGVKYGVMDYTEKAWGMSYGTRYTPKNEENFKAHISAAKAADMVPLEYMSMYFWDGTLDEYISEVARHKTEYGIEGVYTDGLPPLDWLKAYEGVRRLRELFPDGCIIAHTTGQSANGGPPLATPEILIPAIDAYCTMTLRGELVSGEGKNWNYPRFVTSAYGASNAIGLTKGDSWGQDGTDISQQEQDLIGLLYNGRARRAGDLTAYREILKKLEENWRANGWSEEYDSVCYMPYARRLVREKLRDFPSSVLLSDTFDTDSAFTVSPNTAVIDNGRLKFARGTGAQSTFLSSYGKTELSFTLCLNSGTQVRFDLTDAEGNTALSFLQCGEEIYYLHRKGGYARLYEITGEETVNIKIEADPATGLYSFALGENMLLESEPFYRRTAEISGIIVHNGGTAAAYMDNLTVTSGL